MSLSQADVVGGGSGGDCELGQLLNALPPILSDDKGGGSVAKASVALKAFVKVGQPVFALSLAGCTTDVARVVVTNIISRLKTSVEGAGDAEFLVPAFAAMKCVTIRVYVA